MKGWLVSSYGARAGWFRFADCVSGWEEAPVIHPVALGGPGCRAVPGGSIKHTAALLRVEEEARHRSELALACTSRPGGERKLFVEWPGSCGVGRCVVEVVVGCSVQAADLAVPEAVVAEGEDLAGDRDFRDSAAAAFRDPFVLRAQRSAAAGDALGGFGERPARDVRALVGDVPEAGFPVGAADSWREAGPGAEVPGGREPVDLSDLGDDEHRDVEADPGICVSTVTR
jgi:hypothetical protein